MTDNEYGQIVSAARERIRSMDKIDSDNGVGFPIPLDVTLGNVEAAIGAAIRQESIAIMADALAMLEQRNDPSKVRWVQR